MGSSFRAAAALVAFFAAIPLHAQQPPSATTAQHFQQLVESTQLNRKGAQPFHLNIDAQIYNVVGRADETGTIEEWWAAPDEYRIEINSGSLHRVVASGQPSAMVDDTRTSYLLDLLLQATIHPLVSLAPSEELTFDKRKYGKVTLDCYQYGPSQKMLSSACIDPSDGMLRVQTLNDETIVRNSVGTFHGTDVALAIKIAFLGHDVVAGKITALQTFTPGSPGSPTLTAGKKADSSDNSPVNIAGDVVKGHLLRHTNPEYPALARLNHLAGTVLLHGIITREGKIRALFVLSSPDGMLSAAAITAVRNWTYTPYLLNGQPVEVDTTISVNFNLSG